MKKILITCLSAIALLTAFSGSVFSQQKQKIKVAKPPVNNDDDSWTFDDKRSPGTWDAVIDADQVNIQFYGLHWGLGRNIPASELGPLPTDKISEFVLNREAGKASFKGVFQGRFGHGTYQFEENAQFKAYLAQRGFKGLDNELMMNVFFTDINKGYFDYLKENGYATITSDQFKDLAEQDLSRKKLAEYFDLFKTEGYGHQTIDKIVELREHGVSAKFVNGFHQAGFKNIPLDKVLELRDHGVSPEFISQFTALGYKDISLDKALDLRDHGVNPAFISSIQKMGYGKLTLDKAQELRDHGVNPQFIDNLKKLGYADLSLEKAQELRDHGVNADFIRGVQKMGFKDLTLDKAQELRDHGVNLAYMQKVKSKNPDSVKTLDDYIKLRDSGF
ncbi:hypothetical protein KXD93_19160 [Mucilaginibacter sp. BJC16-A38]|uniref:hypothetical protein n=1 Tax=Mucilaginibacter phenanthrenivorans TaxID=1234842 RepID=UPI00215797B4|nr:hypothetical protein [Mucilaginibacter phenanthrenivorans]MCR8559778.1 hypothetical protein [Mucilaginibacter phenanthrenivorans]